MAGTIQIESETPIVAGQPASFRVICRPDQAIGTGGRVRLIYDYRGSDRQESAGQTTTPTAANHISCASVSGLVPELRAYSVAHSYKPLWSEEPECFMWLEVLGPEVSLNCHVVEAAFTKGDLPADEPLTFNFGGNENGYLLSRKSYEAYPFWGILDPAGHGQWRAVGQAAVQIEPASPFQLIVTFPSMTFVGEESTAHIQAFDRDFNAVACQAVPRLPAIPGVEMVQDTGRLRFTTAGAKHLGPGNASPLVIESNPSLVLEMAPANRLFWGDIHGHANICDGGVRRPDEYFGWGREVMALDFCALTSHDFGLALSGPETQWAKLQAMANQFNAPGSFATFVAWEASHIGLPSGRAVGHKNLIFKEAQVPFVNGSNYGTPRVQVDYHTYPELANYLQDLACLVIPHHPLNPVLPGGLGTNWNEFWPERERLVEIYSLWGISEEMDSPGRTAAAVEGASVLTALMRGYRLGFIAGSDTHDGRPANRSEPWSTAPTGGLTAIFAPTLTREAVYDALWQRACYATTGARIILHTDIGGLSMGQTRHLTRVDELIHSRKVGLQVVGSEEIDRAEVIRNGQIVHSFVGDGLSMDVTWIDFTPLPMIALTDPAGQRFVFYYIRVRQKDGHWAWASPVWFDLEEISD